MIKACYVALILFFGLISGQLFSQTTAKYSNEFLAIGIGARSFGMSNSTVASVTGETSVYWNPAALLSLDHSLTVGLMHSEYFAGLSQYDFGTLAFKIDDQASLAFSMIRFGVDNIPNTLELIDNEGNIRFDRIKSFSVADYAFFITYARKLRIDGLSVGGNAKIIRRVGGDFASAWGFGIDASALYTYQQWKIGVMLRDITTTFNAWTYNTSKLEDVFLLTGNAIPQTSTEITLPKIIVGGSRTFKIYDRFEALAEIDLDISTDGKRNVLIKGDPFSIDPHFGGELNYKRLIFLRMGVGNIQNEYDFDGSKSLTVQPNIGMGIHYKRVTIDYALTDLGNVSAAGYSHVFSLSYGIDKLNSPKKN